MSTELTRRPAEEADKPFVWEANRRAYEDVVVRQFGQWDEDIQESNFNEKWEDADFEVVELAGERVGAIWKTDEGKYLRLREVFLLPDYQGKGIGSQLVKQELARAPPAPGRLPPRIKSGAGSTPPPSRLTPLRWTRRLRWMNRQAGAPGARS